MGKSTISMVIFNSKLLAHQMVNWAPHAIQWFIIIFPPAESSLDSHTWGYTSVSDKRKYYISGSPVFKLIYKPTYW